MAQKLKLVWIFVCFFMILFVPLMLTGCVKQNVALEKDKTVIVDSMPASGTTSAEKIEATKKTVFGNYTTARPTDTEHNYMLKYEEIEKLHLLDQTIDYKLAYSENSDNWKLYYSYLFYRKFRDDKVFDERVVEGTWYDPHQKQTKESHFQLSLDLNAEDDKPKYASFSNTMFSSAEPGNWTVVGTWVLKEEKIIISVIERSKHFPSLIADEFDSAIDESKNIVLPLNVEKIGKINFIRIFFGKRTLIIGSEFRVH